jgi:truncated hemoglobin YjbI
MLAAHRRLNGLRPEFFAVWLDLFDQTVDEHFSADAGAALRERARKTARNLQLALFHRPGETGDASRPASAAIREESA